MELIFCGIAVLLVAANVGANILAQRARPMLDGDSIGRDDGDSIDRQHEYGILVKLLVFAIVIGGLGAVAIGHVVPDGLR